MVAPMAGSMGTRLGETGAAWMVDYSDVSLAALKEYRSADKKVASKAWQWVDLLAEWLVAPKAALKESY